MGEYLIPTVTKDTSHASSSSTSQQYQRPSMTLEDAVTTGRTNSPESSSATPTVLPDGPMGRSWNSTTVTATTTRALLSDAISMMQHSTSYTTTSTTTFVLTYDKVAAMKQTQVPCLVKKSNVDTARSSTTTTTTTAMDAATLARQKRRRKVQLLRQQQQEKKQKEPSRPNQQDDDNEIDDHTVPIHTTTTTTRPTLVGTDVYLWCLIVFLPRYLINLLYFIF